MEQNIMKYKNKSYIMTFNIITNKLNTNNAYD